MNVVDILEHEGRIVFSEDEIGEIVEYLYNQLKQFKVVAFSGPLGVGKTTLIRALLRKCGIKEPVTSPTFIYINRYTNDEGQTFYHFDLYRIESVSDFLEAGFDEYFEQPNSWVFIEWPEVIMPLLKDNVCLIKLDYHDEKRKLQMQKFKKTEK